MRQVFLSFKDKWIDLFSALSGVKNRKVIEPEQTIRWGFEQAQLFFSTLTTVFNFDYIKQFRISTNHLFIIKTPVRVCDGNQHTVIVETTGKASKIQ